MVQCRKTIKDDKVRWTQESIELRASFCVKTFISIHCIKAMYTLFAMDLDICYSFFYCNFHCVKSVRVRSYPGPHFLHSNWIRKDTEYLFVFSRNAGKVQTRITPNTDTFHAVFKTSLKIHFCYIWGKVFKIGLSKFCGRQPLKNLKGYSLLKQTILLQIFFKGCLP